MGTATFDIERTERLLKRRTVVWTTVEQRPEKEAGERFQQIGRGFQSKQLFGIARSPVRAEGFRIGRTWSGTQRKADQPWGMSQGGGMVGSNDSDDR